MADARMIRAAFGPLAVGLLLALAADRCPAQETRQPAQPVEMAEAADRPISEIVIEGADRVDHQLIRNQLRTAVGDPLEVETVSGDIRLLNRLGEFASIEAVAELKVDGSVRLVYRVVEQPMIAEVQVVGNDVISDEDLLAAVPLVRHVARDNFLIQNSVRAIEDLYRKRGYYLTTVEVDESELQESGILLFRVIEGPRVRIKDIEFSGNDHFTAKELRPQVGTQTSIFLLRKGELDEQRLIDDVDSLVEFYADRGFLDVRVDRRIEISPDSREAKVTFLIAEGPRYILRSVTAQRVGGGPLQVLHPAQVAAILSIKPGDVHRRDKLRSSIEEIEATYGLLGYLDVEVRDIQLHTPEAGLTDLLLEIDEGRKHLVGLVNVSGNFLTKDKVIRRHLKGIEPGRPFDGTQIEESRRRLNNTRLFNEVRITVQEPDEADPEYRDVLVEVKERNTGSYNFGVGIGSDSGVFGELGVSQDNYDVADLPESISEWIKGRAFRGAGQKFNLSLQPGTEVSQYSLSLTEPYFLETNNSLRGATFYRQREFEDYDEDRLNASARLGRRLGEVWELGLNSKIERVELEDIEASAPVDVFEDAGPNTLTTVGLSLTRTTIGTVTRPGKGSRFEIALDQTGALGGDFSFTTVSAEHTVFLTLDEDFFGRRSILKLSGRVAYIFGDDEAPIYEQFYLGGRSFRGFEFRTISPKGIRADTGTIGDDPVGGEWLLFLGTQYEFPLFEEVITGVLFLDTGTVTDEVGIDDYRAAVGFGIRLYIQQLGPLPIAFDFGFPVLKEDGDEEELLSFSADFPF